MEFLILQLMLVTAPPKQEKPNTTAASTLNTRTIQRISHPEILAQMTEIK
jgi:hypothetical protein